MEIRKHSPKQPARVARLVRPISVKFVGHATMDVAIGRLHKAVESNAPMEPQGPDGDQRLIGEISERSIRLSVTDANWTRRRKGWRVEFVGMIEPGPEGCVLTGEVDIEDHAEFRVLMRLFRVGAALPILFSIVYAATFAFGVERPFSPALLGIGIGILALISARWLENSIEDAAADDAHALINLLKSQLT
jgi:hypothetical protein